MSFDDLGEESEFIPLMTSEDEAALEKESLPEVLPILPLINTVLFPGVVIPINAGRDKSIKLINDANKSNKLIGVVAQKNSKTENPTIENIFAIGTVAKILRVLKMPDGNKTVLVKGSMGRTSGILSFSSASSSSDVIKGMNSDSSPRSSNDILSILLKIILISYYYSHFVIN